MTQISRRSIAKGAAWSVPAVAVASAAPALAASDAPPAGCLLTDAQLNAGTCSAPSIRVIGGRTYSTTSGGAINATTANNFALQSTCNYSGSVSVYFYDPSTQLGSQVAPATLALTNDKTYQGKATLGSIGSGIVQTGWDMSVSILWANSTGSNNPASAWNGATVTMPFDFYYTAPNGSLHTCHFAMQYTMSADYSGLVRPMTAPTVIQL